MPDFEIQRVAFLEERCQQHGFVLRFRRLTGLHGDVHCEKGIEGCSCSLRGFSLEDQRQTCPAFPVNKDMSIFSRKLRHVLICWQVRTYVHATNTSRITDMTDTNLEKRTCVRFEAFSLLRAVPSRNPGIHRVGR